VKELFLKIIDVYEDQAEDFRHIHINHGQGLEEIIDKLRQQHLLEYRLRQYTFHSIPSQQTTRTNRCQDFTLTKKGGDKIIRTTNKLMADYHLKTGEDTEGAITDAKYAFDRGALRETLEEDMTKDAQKKT
jgi:cell division protein YceG involved in septum cleavage